MKKVTAKKTNKKLVRKRTKHRATRFKGMSWMSFVLVAGMLSIMLGGVLYTTNQNYESKDQYLVDPSACEGDKDNLHLCTFRAISVTPTPEPTPTYSAPPQDSGGGGNNNGGGDGGGDGDGDGGSSAPRDGGGSGGGSGGGGGGSGGPPPL